LCKEVTVPVIRSFCLSLFFLLTANFLAIAGVNAQANIQTPSEYKLGGGDSVRVTVFLNPELATEARLSEKGEINFPLIGVVKIGGLQIADAEKLISDQLKQGGFVQKAQVLLSVIAYRSQVVSVLGSVARPGRYPLEVPNVKVTDLLASAGGVAPGGADTVILVRQNGKGEQQKIDIDLPSIFLDGKSQLDLVLEPGDSLYVHRQANFFISGSVGRPGVYSVDRGLSIGQAIAKGGSYTLRSRESGVRLFRRDLSGRVVERTPSMDELIQPDDHIFIRESLF
jgi:polysaccharide biosynthesis/export protein